jgi:trans-aconitate methyltransferase
VQIRAHLAQLGVALSAAIPGRVRWAVQRLNIDPDDQVLEIGCGPGVAVSIVCDQLDRGSITGIDRSATAIARAIQRNVEHVASGRAVLRQVDLAALALPGTRFHKVFAINVNLFWLPSAATELTIIRKHLRPGGVLHLFYETPDSGRTSQVVDRAAEALRHQGFPSVVIDTVSPRLFLISGQALIASSGQT